ncbi:MAG: GIY-YIG nuclease family protein [Nitrospiraceae bacterium]|nr:MAG: GIY-YIG nuclease family protein [Nitrospiraceae bacterium]
MKRHKQGRSKYTKPKRPWKLLYSEYFETRKEAVARESKLKSLKRKDLLSDRVRRDNSS